MQTIECLQHYVRTCNEAALQSIKMTEFRVAMELLLQCEEILLSGVAGNYPNFKFQTFNNIAHAHNVQGNVRLSLKYLLKSLEFGAQIDQQNQGQPHSVPLVETYINISNAYSFLGNLEKALEFAEYAIQVSQRQLELLMAIIENHNLSIEQKEEYGKQYHQQVTLHVMSFQLKGQLLEKMKQFEQAMEEYHLGKKVVEANYGVKHKMYIELVNAINGAKLRTKYIQHSNIPEHLDLPESQDARLNNSQQVSSLNIISDQNPSNNLFLKEQEMMKPISQQNIKQRRLRPSSAQQNKPHQSQKINRHSQNHSNSDLLQQESVSSIKNTKYQNLMIAYEPGIKHVKRIPWPSNLGPQQSPQYSTRSSSNSARSKLLRNSSGVIRPKKNKLRITQGVLHNPDGSSPQRRQPRNSHNSQTVDYQTQIEDLKQMHREQNELIHQLLKQQQQYQSQTNFAQTSQMSQHSPGANQINPFQMPYPSVSQPPMAPQMFYPPPQSFPYYQPPPQYMMYPPPIPPSYATNQSFSNSARGGFFPPPIINNSTGSHQGTNQRATPEKEYEYLMQHNPNAIWDQFRQDQHQNPNQFVHPSRQIQTKNYSPDHQMSFQTDLERDSLFIENSSRQNKQSFKPAYQTEVNRNEKLEHHQIGSMNGIVNIEVKKVEKEQNYGSKLKEAAIKIQTYYRRHYYQNKFKSMLGQMRVKEKFYRSFYLFKEGKKQKKVLLAATLVFVKKAVPKGFKNVPSHIMFQFYDSQEKKVIFESTHKLEIFGVRNTDNFQKLSLINSIKAMLSQMHITGNPQKDILEALKHKFKANHETISFIDPKYFEVGLEQVKKVKIQEPKAPEVKKQVPVEKVEEVIEHDFIEESIEDEFEENISSKSSSSSSSSSSSEKEKKSKEQIAKTLTFGNEKVKEEQKKEAVVVEKKVENKVKEEQKGPSKKQQEAAARLIQAKVRGMLLRQFLKTLKKQRQSTVICKMFVKNPQNMISFVTVSKQKDKYHFSVALKSKRKCPLFKKVINTLPFDVSFIKDFLQNSLQIIYNEKTNRITDIQFKELDATTIQTKTIELEEDKLQINTLELNEAMNLVENAAIKIQSRMRGVIARNQFEYMKDTKQICTFVLIKNRNVAKISVKRDIKSFDDKKGVQENLNKLKIVAANMNKRIQPHIILLVDKLPIQLSQVKEYLQQALEVKWSFIGQTIERVTINDKNVDWSKFNGNLKMEIAEEPKLLAPKLDYRQALERIIKMQAIIRGFLVRQHLKYQRNHKIICKTMMMHNRNVAKIVIKKNLKITNKAVIKGEGAPYKLVVSNMAKRSQIPFKYIMEILPVEEKFLKQYLDQALEIKWSFQGSKIEKVSFKDQFVEKSKLQGNVVLVVNPENVFEKEKPQLPQTQQKLPLKEKKNELAKIIKVQALARGFLLRMQLKYQRERKVLCKQIMIQNRNVAKVVVKKNIKITDKNVIQGEGAPFKLVVANMSKRSQTHFKIMLDRLPVEVQFLKQYVDMALEIKWSFFGSTIEKVQLNDKNVDWSKLKLLLKFEVNPKTNFQKQEPIAITEPPKGNRKDSLSKLIKLQALARGFLLRMQLKYQKDHKVICKLILTQGGKVAKVMVKKNIKITDKKVIIGQGMPFKLVVSNMSKRSQPHIKIPIQKFSVGIPYLYAYLQQAIKIKWSFFGSTIDSVKLKKDSKIDFSKILPSVNMEDTNGIKIQSSPVKPKQVIEEKKQEVKPVQKEIKKPEPKKKSKLLQLIKIQARVRGVLARNSSQLVLAQEMEMLMRLSRKLSNNKLYFIFLMQKNIKLLRSADDTLYLVTLRQVQTISEIYDLEISVKKARYLFKREGITQSQQNKLILFKHNKEEFLHLLNSLDIVDGKEGEEFSLDAAKFKRLKNTTSNLKIIDSEVILENAMGLIQQNQPQKQTTKSPIQQKQNQKEEVKAKHVEDQSNDEYDDEYYGEEDDGVIEEADSKFEVSPSPNTKPQSNSNSNQKSNPSSVIKKPPTSPIQKVDLRTLKLIISIQRHIRGFLGRKRAQLAHERKQMRREKGTSGLVLYEQSMLKLCDLYFMQFIYVDKTNQDVKYTLREMAQKITIIKLKTFSPKSFGRKGVETDDIICAIEETLLEYEEYVLLDSKKKTMYEDWPVILRKFIEDEGKLMKLVKSKILEQ